MDSRHDDVRTTLLYQKTLGCLMGGLIGDAMGTPTENKDYREIEEHLGWVEDFEGDGTDDTVMKNLLAEALIRTDGYATLDDWAQVWLDHWEAIFGPKLPKFFISVVHTARKLKLHAIPRMAALGNMPSSSSAMCISPVGIVNACNPRQAALQAYNLASLLHIHDVGYCQDGAAAMAAAVAAAFVPGATFGSVIEAAIAAIAKLSGREMLARIDTIMSLARKTGQFRAFREAVYELGDGFFCRIACDSRETVPLTLGLFFLAEGEVEKSVVYAANLGRDADTIASMSGAIAGALQGVEGIKAEWTEKAKGCASVDQEELAERLVGAGWRKHQAEKESQSAFDSIAGS